MEAWATPEALLNVLADNFDDAGNLKDESKMLARGTFAVVFLGSIIPGGDAASVIRIAVIPPGGNQEVAFEKELQALKAYLKLTKSGGSEPPRDKFVEIPREEQPVGLCRTDAFFIVTTEGRRAVFTIMPLGTPLMHVIEEQLVLASQGGEQAPRDLEGVIRGVSQLAVALKTMHKNAVYWRDCKVRGPSARPSRAPSGAEARARRSTTWCLSATTSRSSTSTPACARSGTPRTSSS